MVLETKKAMLSWVIDQCMINWLVYRYSKILGFRRVKIENVHSDVTEQECLSECTFGWISPKW